MRRLVKVQTTLSQMVISNQWGIWKASNSERAQKVKALVLDDSWWARVQFVLDFTDPIMTMLCFADTDTPCLGDVYDGMDNMIEKVKLVIQNHENDPTECEALCNKVEAIIHHCWEKMTTPLHLLAYALFPRYYSQQVLGMPGRVAPYADEEVANGCYKAFTRLFLDDQMHDSVREEFGLFASGSKMSTYAIKDQYKTGAITWWYMYGQPFKYLQPLAIKILSQVFLLFFVYHMYSTIYCLTFFKLFFICMFDCVNTIQVSSSSVAKRNWSTYSYIHSVKRNWLGSKKAEDLVYIHTNLRLLSRNQNEYKEGSTKLWDVVPECANLDAMLHDLTVVTNDGDETITHGASGTSGTILGSNDLDLAAIGLGDNENVDFLENPYDSQSD